MTRLDTTDQARAYGAWSRAAGDVVAANARPRSFARGLLTVECASPIWAQELTYLGGQILTRMAELDPAHPIERLRFVARGAPGGYAAQPAAGGVVDEAPPARALTQENEPAPAKESRRDETPQRADLGAAREGARQVGDERLRNAIQATLAAAADGPPASTSGGPSVNPEK